MEYRLQSMYNHMGGQAALVVSPNLFHTPWGSTLNTFLKLSKAFIHHPPLFLDNFQTHGTILEHYEDKYVLWIICRFSFIILGKRCLKYFKYQGVFCTP